MDVIAHRGARLLAVENTVEALHIAWNEGADGVEFDVQVCGDGELIAFHDGSLAAWTGDARPIGEVPWRELRAIDLVDSEGHRGTIAHLDEVIESLQGQSGLLNLELKVADGDPDRALDLAERVASRLKDSSENWVISSFSKAALVRFASSGLPFELAAIVHEKRDWDFSAMADRNDPVAVAAAFGELGGLVGDRFGAVHVHGRTVTPELLSAWRGFGAAVRPWVVNGEQHWAMCVHAAVDAAITDDPGGLRSFLGGW